MDQPAHKKPSKAAYQKALKEIVPDLIRDQNYNDTTAEFLMGKITQAVAQRFKGCFNMLVSTLVDKSRASV